MICLFANSERKALTLAEALANEFDPIRKKYWHLRVEEMKQKMKSNE